MWYISKERAMEIAQALVVEHAPLIAMDLGFGKNPDGILDRITVLPVHDAFVTYHGEFSCRAYDDTGEYEDGSGNIAIYVHPHLYLHERVKKGMDLVTYRFNDYRAMFFRKHLERKIVHTLAHEFRHYYQVVHAMFPNDRVSYRLYQLNYEDSPEEQDADAYADLYVKRLK